MSSHSLNFISKNYRELRGTFITASSSVQKLNRKRFIAIAVVTFFTITTLTIIQYNDFKSVLNYVPLKDPFLDSFSRSEYLAGKSDKSLLNIPVIQSHKIANHIDKDPTEDSYSQVYDVIFKKHNVKSIMSLAFEERCDLYFATLFKVDPNWYLNPLDQNINIDRNPKLFDFDAYAEAMDSSLKAQIVEMDEIMEENIPEEVFEAKMMRSFRRFWEDQMVYEQNLVNHLSHLKIYNKCYLSNENKVNSARNKEFVDQQQQNYGIVPAKWYEQQDQLRQDIKEDRFMKSIKTCAPLESRIYKWLSRTYPTYIRWTGDIYLQPPKMDEYLEGEAKRLCLTPTNRTMHRGRGTSKIKSRITNNNKSCFLADFKREMNGKGIVLYVAESNLDEASSLITLLRALNNKYPIQVIFNSDQLSEQGRNKLRSRARESIDTFPDSLGKVKEHFPNGYGDSSLAPQELWFVDIKWAINNEFRKRFFSFDETIFGGNIRVFKFLAALFNSFEEFIYIDSKTIPLKNPDYFFNQEKYRNSGTYFYKDKSGGYTRPKHDIKFFSKITPSIVDNFMFDMQVNGRAVVKNKDFFDLFMYEYMDDGMLVMDRNIHFNTILTMVHMGLFRPVSERISSEKEMWWLAMLVTGEMDTSYEFNENYAANIGEETEFTRMPAREVCGTHVGHVNEKQNSLDWMRGSGFQYCPDFAYRHSEGDMQKEYDSKHNRFPFLSTFEEYYTYMHKEIEIKHAIIPAFIQVHDTYTQSGGHGWVSERFCKQKLWCAYSSQKEENDADIQKGVHNDVFIRFQQKDVDLWSYYGDMWKRWKVREKQAAEKGNGGKEKEKVSVEEMEGEEVEHKQEDNHDSNEGEKEGSNEENKEEENKGEEEEEGNKGEEKEEENKEENKDEENKDEENKEDENKEEENKEEENKEEENKEEENKEENKDEENKEDENKEDENKEDKGNSDESKEESNEGQKEEIKEGEKEEVSKEEAEEETEHKGEESKEEEKIDDKEKENEEEKGDEKDQENEETAKEDGSEGEHKPDDEKNKQADIL